MFGNGGLALPVCSFLLLHLPVLPLTNNGPVKDRSEGRVEQRSIHLQSHSFGSQNVKQTSNKEEVFQWWGEWSSWSSCSRSCGGGVRSQERHCLIQRLSTTQNVNSSYCVGSPKQYQLCPNQLCPSPSVSFKQQQCSQFNSKAFGRRYYQWIPLYPGYVFITNIPAGASDIQIIERHKTENILALSDEAGHFFFNGNTVFHNPQNFRVAGTVFKYRRPSNVFSDGLEYIIAQGPTLQGLNVMYYNMNGKLPHITYEYTIPRTSHDITAAQGITTGPSHSHLNLTYNEVNEDVRGDLLRAMNHSRVSVTTVHHYNTQLGADDQSDVRLHEEEEEEVVWEVRTPSPPPPAAMLVFRPADVTSQVFSHNDVEERGPPVPSGYRSSSNSIDEPSTDEDNSLLLSFPGSQSVHSAELPEDAPYLLLEDLHHNQTQSNTHSVKHTLTDPHSPAETQVDMLSATDTELDADPRLELHSDILTVTDTHSVVHTETQTDTHTAILVQLQQVSAVQAANTESNDFDVGLDPDISLADMYRWKVSAYAPCSSTCTTGITASYALCVRYDGTEVDDSYCDSLTRPEPTHEFCTGKECPPRWETSGWSECSRTCGEGVQYRTVRCWKMLSPGLDSSVYDSLCLSHDLHKPANRKVCLGQSCGPQWEVSEWSECSARCGSRGVRSREVRCSMEMRLCNKSSQPIESQECEGPPCDRRWTVSDWGPCSGLCGEGRMMRAVMCRSSGGIVMSEEQCDQSLRPLAIYPCGDRDCAPHWVEQEWQQCNATCGRGVRQRQVVCAGLDAGVFKEFPDSSCDQTNKPETSSSCFQRPCSKWFTTSWSQCSKTCGSGVQVREVKCYQGEELVTRGHSCDSALKPEARQSCQIQSCPTEAPAAAPAASVAVDDACQDKPTANCALVLKVKLCSHWYYRKACCQSCKAPRP
ncbi:ADAMTS-like protein 2 isoform X5 [Pagrus major]|uniref:ADAMTS-like protein 2 isoform X5 n=1 Tax=Pagrus major TaxID=143350 RepID=UPI003CC84C3A